MRKLMTTHADSSIKTVPLLYSSLNTAKIIQPPHLTDAITDDSYLQAHLASSTNKFHADGWLSKVLHSCSVYYVVNP
jgi:hypothetical protein